MLEPFERAARTTFQECVRLMVNLRFAIGLLTVIGLVSIGATLLGGIYSEDVQMAVFRSPFFNLLMLVFTFALALALASRWPWKKSHIGWICTHIGLIVIVFGHLATESGGINGQVDLQEGQSTTQLEQKDWVLTADVQRFGARLTSVLDIDAEPDSPIFVRRPTFLSRLLGFFGLQSLGEVAGPKSYTLPGGDTLTVEKYWPTYAVRTRAEPDFTPGAPPAPAVLFEIRAGKHRLSEWLFADEPDESQKALGQELRIVHRRFDTAAQLEAAVGPAATQQTTPGKISALEIVDGAPDAPTVAGPHGQAPAPRGKTLAEVDLTLASGDAAVPLGTTGYSVRVLRRFDRLAVGEKGPVERPDGPPNPAVVVEVTDPSGVKDRRFIFGEHGEIGGSMTLPFRLVYEPPGSSGGGFSRLPPSSIAVVEAPARAPEVVLVEPDGTQRRFALTLGAPIPLPWLGAEASFIERFERARSVSDPWCSSYAMNRPGVLVTVRPPVIQPVRGMGGPGGDGAASSASGGVRAWVVWNGMDEPTTIEGSQGPIELRLGPRRLPLGFTIQLQDFVLETYEGTDNPKSFESYVRVTPHDGEAPFDYHIYMNHPLTYRGITFFQSSYDPETLQRSIFAVSKDPGWPIVYLGYALLTGGLAFVVYLKPRIIRRDAERLAREGLARAAEKKAKAAGAGEAKNAQASASEAGSGSPGADVDEVAQVTFDEAPRDEAAKS